MRRHPQPPAILNAHRALSQQLETLYHCERAGVDEDHDILWLWRIDLHTEQALVIPPRQLPQPANVD